MSESRPWFLLSYLATLGLGIVLVERQHSSTNAEVFFAAIAASLLFQAIVTGIREPKDEDAPATAAPESALPYYRGVALAPEPDRREAEALDEILDRRKGIARKVAQYALLAAIGYAVVRLPDFHFHLSGLIFLISAIIILFAASLGHLLIPLGLNLAVVLASISFGSSGGLPISPLHAVYVVSVFATLLLYRRRELSLEMFSGSRWVLSALGLAALPLSLAVLADRLLPLEKPPELRTSSNGFGHGSGGRGGWPPIPLPSSSVGQDLSPADLKRWMNLLEKMPVPPLPRGVRLPTNPSSRNAPQAAPQVSQTELREVQKALEQASRDAELRDQAVRITQKWAQALQQGASGPGDGESPGNPSGSGPPGLQSGESTSTSPAPTLPDLPTTVPVDLLARILSYVMILGSITGLVVFFYRLWKKFRPDQIGKSLPRKLDRKMRAALRAELAGIQARRLPPEQEVIAKYHFCLRILAAANHPRPEFLPPLDYCRDVSRFYPNLETDLSGVTEVFADVFYGKQPQLAAPRLGQFRTNLDSIVRTLVG